MKELLASCLILLAMTASTFGVEDDNYKGVISMEVPEGAAGSAISVARFLGFRCPKGYRCLPVLECLPCDYGSYKSEEGSALCTNCPSGCTTLRKGAESWKECVPKCPPGYEESECGKTCSKCRVGHYKSNWQNERCIQCPSDAHFDHNMVGMTEESQCYAFDSTTIMTPETISDTGSCETLGPCDADEYSDVRLVPAPGSGCRQFCQCSYEEGSTGEQQTQHWVLHNCGDWRLFDATSKVCDHENVVQCDAYDPTVTGAPETSMTTAYGQSTDIGIPDDTDCDLLGICDAVMYAWNQYLPAPGWNCMKYCQCAYQEGSAGTDTEYRWVLQECAPGTAFDTSTNVCNYEYLVNCEDYYA